MSTDEKLKLLDLILDNVHFDGLGFWKLNIAQYDFLIYGDESCELFPDSINDLMHRYFLNKFGDRNYNEKNK